MRIGINLLSVNPEISGGTSVYSVRLCQNLLKFDKQNDYILLVKPENISIFSNLNSNNVHFLTWWDKFELLTAFSQRVSIYNLDLIHYPMQLALPYISSSIPIVLSFFDIQHEYYPENFSREELAFRKTNYQSSIDRAQRVITSSNYTIETLKEKFDTTPDRCISIHSGLDYDLWKPANESEINRIRSLYQLPDSFVIYPANSWPHKNHFRLIEAISKLRDEYGLIENLVLTGQLINNNDTSIDSCADKYQVRQQIINLGYVPETDMPGLYSAAKGMIFPSLFEGGGSFAMIEAMACDLPLACSNLTSIPECVGNAAILFNPLDVEDIVNSIKRLIIDEPLRQQLIENGRIRLNEFNWKSIIPKIITVYKDVVGEGLNHQFWPSLQEVNKQDQSLLLAATQIISNLENDRSSRGDQIQQYSQWLKESEDDRDSLKDQIGQYSKWLKESEDDRDSLKDQIGQYSKWLKESEDDRSARWDQIQQLSKILKESDDDRSSRMDQIKDYTKIQEKAEEELAIRKQLIERPLIIKSSLITKIKRRLGIIK